MGSFKTFAIALLFVSLPISAQAPGRKISATAQSEADGTTPLHRAVHSDDLSAAQRLLQAGANPNAANRYGVTPLSLAAENGNAAMIDTLLKAGANPKANLPGGQTMLMTAARTGNA